LNWLLGRLVYVMRKKTTLGRLKKIEDKNSLYFQLQTNKNEALKQIVKKYGDRVYSTAYNITRNHSDAEEVFQDVFLTVYTKINSLRKLQALSSWIYKITVNLANLRMRACSKSRIFVYGRECDSDRLENLEKEDRTVCIVDKMLDEEAREVIEHAIKELPPEYKSVIVLNDLNDISLKTMSDILHLSIPAVKSRLHRARKKLRHKLDTYFVEEVNGKR
jgi:RNA polymerase sigma-70 factor, ECF subfamily